MVIGLLHHFAAELPMTQVAEGFGTAKQHAQPIGAVELVAGKHVKVATQCLDVVAAMDHTLGAVDHRQCALGLGQCQQGRHRLPGAEHIG
ncbi:hypothetical protein D3C80_1896110 [compost metagenome]